MFWIFKKKSQLKYVELANNNPNHIISAIIISIAKLLKEADKKSYSYLNSDYGIFEHLVLVFITIHSFTYCTKEHDDIREALFEKFLLISANVFSVEFNELEPLINNRWKRYSSLGKEDNYELLYATVLSYCKIWASTNHLPIGSEYKPELNFLISMEWSLFIENIYHVMMETTTKIIKGLWDKKK